MAKTKNMLSSGGEGNTVGYVGEIEYFLDASLRPNHLWADGTQFSETDYPELALYAQMNNWSAGSLPNTWKTPVISGNVSGWNMSFTVYAQIRAKPSFVNVTSAVVDTITPETASTFPDRSFLITSNGNLASKSLNKWCGPHSVSSTWIPMWIISGLGTAGIIVSENIPTITGLELYYAGTWTTAPLNTIYTRNGGSYFIVSTSTTISGPSSGSAILGRISYTLN